MGRKKTEFTKEQDERITQLANDGHSLNEILVAVNDEFQTNFSRSGIDRRIKALGIERISHKKSGGGVSVSLKMAERVEELREWKRKQSYTFGAITEQNIADAMGVCVKTLKKMYKQFDIPKRLYYQWRPDIYFDVKQCDCTTLKKSVADRIYAYIMKMKPQDMRVERDVIVRIDPMTIHFYDYCGDRITRCAKMKAVDMKVDFYFPDYKTAFFCNTVFKDFIKDNVEQNGSVGSWSSYLKKHKCNIKLMDFVPMRTPDAREYSLEFAAQTMIERAISGEYNQWKSLKDQS